MLHRVLPSLRKPISPEMLALALAVYFSVFLNDSLWQALAGTQRTMPDGERMTFMVASWIGITSFHVAFISLLLWGRLTKLMAIVLILITVSAHFFNIRYGVMFDVTMMRNVLATNPAEAGELLTPGLALHFLVYGLVPIGFITLISIKRHSLVRTAFTKLAVMAFATVLAFAAMALNYKNFSSSMRNHKEVRHLVLPASPAISLMRTAAAQEAKFPKEKELLTGPVTKDQGHARPLLLVLVVGESVRAQNWGLSGYARQTTPQLAQLDKSELFNFPYIVSCGTNTEISVPCMFSVFGKHSYDETKIRKTESVLELMHRAGVATTWIDNQSGCKGTCTKIPSFQAADLVRGHGAGKDPLDDILVPALDQTFKAQTGDQLIVMHMLGNHGPAYSRRYPKSFEHFKPACESNDLASCSNDMIRNAYDNVIVFTDAVLADMIRKLRNIKSHDVGLIYVSDHGESLGEHGIYLHGLPYAIAPAEQTQVPMMLWLPQATQKRLGSIGACLSRKAATPSHHDFLAHSLLSIYGVRTDAYKASFDWLNGCKAS